MPDDRLPERLAVRARALGAKRHTHDAQIRVLLDGEDPAVLARSDVHFFERFLAAYDPNARRRRGVYATPQPLVDFIVDAVEATLRDTLGFAAGFASPVRVLDPAAGTGVFLEAVIERAHHAYCRCNDPATWTDFVRNDLLDRLLGYEVLPAAHAVCRLRLARALSRTGCALRGDERLRVRLGNPLSRAPDDLAVEVVLGNPPYRVASSNRGGWIDGELAPYKRTVRREERQIQALSDDYVKFFRLAHLLAARAPRAVVGLVTNNTFVRGPLFRDMRAALSADFPFIRVLDLGGNARHGEVDGNVFGIRQGVAVTLLVRGGGRAEVRYSRAQGDRGQKLAGLGWRDERVTPLPLRPPAHAFVPTDDGDALWRASPSVPEVFGTGRPARDRNRRWGVGFTTRHDAFAVGFTPTEAVARIRRFLEFDGSAAAYTAATGVRLCTTAHWSPEAARDRLRAADLEALVRRVLYRPFDERFVVYSRDVVLEPRAAFLAEDELALVTHRIINGDTPRHDFVAERPVDKIALSSRTSTNAFVFPLRLGGAVNLAPAWRARWAALGVGLAEDIMAAMYAALSAPSYRARYREPLARDFARLPTPREPSLARALVGHGRRLIRLHLLTDPPPGPRPGVTGDGFPRVEAGHPRYDAANERVALAKDFAISGVPCAVWGFAVGGYPVCRRWLRARRGRGLDRAELARFGDVVAAVAATLTTLDDLEESVAGHGGWPTAFTA